jgi:hypothetical protein
VEAGEIQKEFAMHLEERHAENGKPEFSQWNKCANLLEDELSLEAREFYQKASYALTSQVIIYLQEIVLLKVLVWTL